MLEAALAIIDRLISLIKGRIEGRKEMFVQVLEPVFNDLVLIHDDYLKIFEQALSLLRSTEDDVNRMLGERLDHLRGRADSDRDRLRVEASAEEMSGQESAEHARIKAAREFLQDARHELEPLRIKVQAFLSALAEADLAEKETKFLQALSHYLLVSEFPDNGAYTTLVSSVVETLESMEIRCTQTAEGLVAYCGDDRSPADVISQAINDTRLQWSNLCVCYAQLKVTVTSQR